ncbi:MAG: ABC transporter ATP-binding protein [Acidobacteriota bacterium]|jgi:putative ABC transport system ATP-binding protein
MSERKAVLQTIALRKEYDLGKAKVEAVRTIDIRVDDGEFVALMGPSGCGKSTLLYMLGGMVAPSSGEVRIDGEDITKLTDAERTLIRRDKIGFVFQRFNLFPTLSALDNVKLAQEIQRWRNKQGRGDPERAQLLLERVGLADKLGNKPYEMSTGEQQRVAIARALVNRPHILLADEPTGNLDTKNSDMVMEVFTSLNEEFDQTMMVITHNPEIAARAHRTIHMRDGVIVDSALEG